MSEWTYTRLTTLPDDVKGRYSGLRDTEPDDPIEGDFYVYNGDDESIRKLTIFVLHDHKWMTLAESGLTNAQKSEIAGIAQKDVLSHLDAGTVTESEYAYFNTLIVGTITADYIKAQEGVFDSIHVTGGSVLDGDVVTNALETRNAVSPEPINLVAEIKTCSAYKGTVERLCIPWDRGTYSNIFTSGTLNGYPIVNTPIRLFVSKNGIMSIYRGDALLFNASRVVHSRFGDITTYVSAPEGFLIIDNETMSSFSLIATSSASEAVVLADNIQPKTSNGSIGTEAKPFMNAYVGTSLKEQTRGYTDLPNGLKLEWGISLVGDNSSVDKSSSITMTHITSILFASACFNEFPYSSTDYQRCGCSYDTPRDIGEAQIHLWGVTGQRNRDLYMNWFAIGK